jgi:hypothetical protein
MNNARRFLNNEQGVALPIAMLALIILSALIIGFSVLASTEPSIANNQLMVAQARSLSEAGIERAVWALNLGLTNPTDPNAIPPSMAGTASAPYDGSQLLPVSIGGTTVGGFFVTVTKPPGVNLERIITAVGWVPNDTPSTRKAHQKVSVTVVGPPAFPPPPAALSVRGELQAGGSSLIDARLDRPLAPGEPSLSSCGAKDGTLTTGSTSISGNTKVYGADGNDNPQSGSSGTPYDGDYPYDAVQGVPTSAFDPYILTDADIDGLRAYAKAHGTYLQGAVSFCASCVLPNGEPALIPNGLVFIDTLSGTNITQEGVTPPTPPSDFADVSIQGNPTVPVAGDQSPPFSGWLFVNGSLRIDGQFQAHGLIYAQNDISYRGIGGGGIWGAMMSRNIRDTSSTSIDSNTVGNALINYNCVWAENGGGMLKTWLIQSGSYKECSGDSPSLACS